MKTTATQARRFNPLNDFLFLKVMGEKGDEEQLLGFLNAVLFPTGTDRFSSVEIMENRTLTAEVLGDKSSILDVRAVLQGSARINVEVQLRNQHNMEKRSLFYWSREFAGSLGTGQNYRELPRVISINILNFEFLHTKDFHSRFHLREDNDMILLTDALEIHYLDMVKWRKRDNKDITGNPLHRWLAWLDPGSSPELIAEVVNMDNAILKANERQEYILSDKEALRAYEMRQLGYWDLVNQIDYARDEGREEGRKENYEEKRRIIANLKTLGIPIETISQATGFTIEEIEKL